MCKENLHAFKGVKCFKCNKYYTFHPKLLEQTSKRTTTRVISATTINTAYDVIVGVPAIQQYNLLSTLASRYSDSITSSSRAREVGPPGQVGSSVLLPSTITELQQSNKKHQTELLSLESEIDDLELYARDSP